MITPAAGTKLAPTTRPLLVLALVLAGLAAFVALFVLVNDAWYRFTVSWYPPVGTSASLASLFGVVSRLHLIVLLAPLVVLRPRLFGFQTGKVRQHWRLLLAMLLANCGVIGAYLWLTGSSTPYSGNEWAFTEVVTVPIVEEVFWRGLVFSLLLAALRTAYPGRTGVALAVALGGLTFGLLHASNILAGVPLQFVAIQVLNATVWGILYGVARARTGSIYPAILLHAAMNLVVVMF